MKVLSAWPYPFKNSKDSQLLTFSSLLINTGLAKALEKGMVNHSSILASRTVWNSMNSKKRQEDMTPGDEPTRSVGVQYARGEEQRNSSRKNEEAGSKWKWCSVADVSGGESKVQCYKEQHCIGIKVNWLWSSRGCEHRHFRNQWTKMGRRGWI